MLRSLQGDYLSPELGRGLFLAMHRCSSCIDPLIGLDEVRVRRRLNLVSGSEKP